MKGKFEDVFEKSPRIYRSSERVSVDTEPNISIQRSGKHISIKAE